MLNKSKTMFITLAAMIMLFIAGCDMSKKESVVDKLKVSGGDQTALANHKFKKQIRIETLGPRHPGLFGGKGGRGPVPNTKVKLIVPEGSDLKVEPTEGMTNSGGVLFATVTAGSKLGDQTLIIEAVGDHPKRKTLRFVSGVSIEGANQETPTGTSLPSPLSVKVADKDGSPIVGVPVYFQLISSPVQQLKKIKAKCEKTKVLTDKDGIASTNIKLGHKTGIYQFSVEISDEKRDIHMRALKIHEMGYDLTGLILTVLGGLAIFIFGMKKMSDGLQLIAGNKMKKVLQFFAKNRFVAVLAGALVTSVIQSSSACTVMVVGFVNAGLLNLTQAIGIVFGANIGTTITAQMIAFKLSWMALPAIIIGLIMMLFFKKEGVKNFGQTIFGFGLLFFGMEMMGHELKVVGQFPMFKAFFASFDCTPLTSGGAMPFTHVLGAIAIGTFVTVVIQSSSASIGIVLALAASGLINFYTAVPLILGDNIGTTITAVLASLAANKRAKQTAMAHVLFNLLGTIGMVIMFYIKVPTAEGARPIFLALIDAITPGEVFRGENLVRHIAMTHTLFNVANVIIFLPFVNVIAKLCNMVIPVQEEEQLSFEYLEPHLLDTPAIAIEQSIQTIRHMTKEAYKMIKLSMNGNFLKGKYDEKLGNKLQFKEEKIDELQENLTKYLVQITQRELTENQSELVPLLMHCTNDAERIADYTENILSLTRRLEATGKELSEEDKKDILEVWSVLQHEAELIINALDNTDKKEINIALEEEKRINKLTKRFEKRNIKALKAGDSDPIISIILLEMFAELEHIGDRFTNIAERTRAIQKHHIQLN